MLYVSCYRDSLTRVSYVEQDGAVWPSRQQREVRS